MAISLSNIKRKNIVKTLKCKITLKICGHMNTNLTNQDYIMRMLPSLMLWSICSMPPYDSHKEICYTPKYSLNDNKRDKFLANFILVNFKLSKVLTA